MTSIPQDYSFQSPAVSALAPNVSYSATTSQTRKKETERRHLREKWDRVSRDVIGMELKMGIDPRWTPDTPNYKATLQYIAERDYQVALEKLHGLVVQRLFELHNMNISQTGNLGNSYDVHVANRHVMYSVQGSYLYCEEPPEALRGDSHGRQGVQRRCSKPQPATSDA